MFYVVVCLILAIFTHEILNGGMDSLSRNAGFHFMTFPVIQKRFGVMLHSLVSFRSLQSCPAFIWETPENFKDLRNYRWRLISKPPNVIQFMLGKIWRLGSTPDREAGLSATHWMNIRKIIVLKINKNYYTSNTCGYPFPSLEKDFWKALRSWRDMVSLVSITWSTVCWKQHNLNLVGDCVNLPSSTTRILHPSWWWLQLQKWWKVEVPLIGESTTYCMYIFSECFDIVLILHILYI